MRSKFYIAVAIAELPPDGEIVDVSESLVRIRQRMKMRPVIFTSPNYSNAYKGVKVMARAFFPEAEGFINHRVDCLAELDPMETVRSLLMGSAITAAGVRDLLSRLRL